ncbi:MAG: hypothetical protein LBR93_01585, partial [Treponema sp.]|jgi:hypothetical protein|nr:hypothetical protein [Treponema sp.]
LPLFSRSRKPAFLFGIFFLCFSLWAPQSLPAILEPLAEINWSQVSQANWPLLIGADTGLFGLDRSGRVEKLWEGGEVRKIVRAGDGWALLSGQGILVSEDLLKWENRSGGLPVKTIKLYEGGVKSFAPMVQEIKDLEVNPANPEIMTCATKDTVYLSRDGGRSWESLGMPSYRTNGIKAVAAAYLPGNGGPEMVLFLSHSIYGIHYIVPGLRGAKWIEMNGGVETLETTGNADEVADIAVIGSAPGAAQEVYISQTFRHRIYRLDWASKKFLLQWSDSAPFGTVDSLSPSPAGLRFIREGMVAELNYRGKGAKAGENRTPICWDREDILDILRGIPENLDLKPNSVVIQDYLGNGDAISLNELWLLDEHDPLSHPETPVAGSAGSRGPAGHDGLYLPVNHAMASNTLQPYLDVIAGRGLDMVVIDMKDDYGRLRFTPRDPAITEKGRVFRPLDIDSFLGEMKKRGVYTAARIVVFKDPVLAAKEGGRYAVWDSSANKAWAGYYDQRRKKTTPEQQAAEKNSASETAVLPASDPEYEILRTWYDERWVDPYSEVVWDYIARISRELHQRGFDEIQFDYIRFPTDGINLGNARYRWRDTGMDMESAIVSFLSHIRSRLEAPVSIDIYGANGWYRTGARTGQEVELLSRYVDVICPMYYPSHFEQDFLAQAPAEQRPYRIYFLGTQRTSRIGRGRVLVRPYVQAFYLNVSYDRRYYNPAYVRLEVEGVRDAGNPGLTYWNNSGRYEDIPRPADIRPGGAGP